MFDSAYVTQTLQKLVQINSVNPSLDGAGKGEKEIGKYIAGELDRMGIKSEIDEIAPGRLNVTGLIPGEGDGKSLILNAHMDTVGVSGMEDPFSGKIKDGKLYGRGAYDMKGSIAAILAAAKELTETQPTLNGDVIFSFVADEEYESMGAQEFVKKHNADAAIVTEPTDMEICLAHRGFGIFKIVTQGKMAHGGNHRLGVDANTKMGLLLAELNDHSHDLTEHKTHPLCGEASAHVPLIKGGDSLFIYSNECTIHFERRTLPGETKQDVTNELNRIIEKLETAVKDFRASVECKMWREPYEISPEKLIVEKLTAASEAVLNRSPEFIGHTWWEDSAIFGETGIETVIMGPKGGGIHEEVEWVEIDSVTDLARILYQTTVSHCSE